MRVIKAHERPPIANIRSPSDVASQAPLPTREDLELRELRDRNLQLSANLAELEGRLAELSAAAASAHQRGVDEGRSAGRAEGKLEAESAVAEHLAVVRKLGVEAVERYALELNSLERLAPLIAAASLEKIFGEAGARGRLVSEIIQISLARLADRGVVRVEVSRSDFAEPHALSQVSLQPESVRTEIRLVDDLEPGGCRIRLSLGAVDVGIGQQWSALKASLLELAEPAR